MPLPRWQLRATSEAEARMVDELFSLCYKLKTGKMKASTNSAGLFLTVMGLRKAQPSPVKKQYNVVQNPLQFLKFLAAVV